MTPAQINKTSGKYVPSEGPDNAKVIVIGEFPWAPEVWQNRPFVSEAGKKQDFWWSEIGLNRREMKLINLYPFQPPRRDIESVSTEALIENIRNLHNEIASLHCPVILVPMGNYAAFALTGKGKVRAAVRNAFDCVDSSSSVAEKKASISKLRGSIYWYKDQQGREIKVIPILHPENIMIMQKWEKRTITDWRRVRNELDSPTLELKRNHIVSPCEYQVEEFTKLVEKNYADLAMSADIETWGHQLSCVGFALSPTESITLPTIGREKDVFLPYVKRLCESQVPKILCNGFYDWYWLAWYKVWLVNFQWDVQLMHHAIDPGENHSLDFLASIYCPSYRFWKDEAKDAEEIIKYAHDLEALWVYNGLDCCYTRELLDLVYADLQQNNLVEFYFRHYQAMIEPLTRTMLHGIRIDKDAQKVWAKKLRGELKVIHGTLNDKAGEELFATEEISKLREPKACEWDRLLNEKGKDPDEEVSSPPQAKYINREERKVLVSEGCTYMMSGKNAGKIRYKVTKNKKDFSRVKLQKFFFETLKLPVQYKFAKGKYGRHRTISVDEGSIRKMTAKWPKKIENWGNLLLAYREKKKELDYLKGSYDSDGRIRCSYKLLTEAGRLASSKNPRGSGYNLQNIKR